VTLVVRIKPRAVCEIHAAALWWQENRPAAPGAIEDDLKVALQLLAIQPRIGMVVQNARDPETRRLYLARVKYFIYYRPRGQFLEVIAFWHAAREQEPRV
jgi:plasmid stabilization system protein ParE